MTEASESLRGLKRLLAGTLLVGIDFLVSLGFLAGTAGVTPAQARGRGGGGRGFARGGRGFVRGRGRGVGVYYGGYGGYYNNCYWSRRYGRWICPYYY